MMRRALQVISKCVAFFGALTIMTWVLWYGVSKPHTPPKRTLDTKTGEWVFEEYEI